MIAAAMVMVFTSAHGATEVENVTVNIVSVPQAPARPMTYQVCEKPYSFSMAGVFSFCGVTVDKQCLKAQEDRCAHTEGGNIRYPDIKPNVDFIEQNNADIGELNQIIDGAIAANSKAIEEFKKGKEKALMSIVGAVMKLIKTDPKVLIEKIKSKIK